MKKLAFILLSALAVTATQAQYTTGRSCIPFDSTFHYLGKGNLNFWVEGGLLITAEPNRLRALNDVAFDINYVPVKYLQTGITFSKKLPAPEGISYWKSYETFLYARYSFIRFDCPKVGMYVHGGYAKIVEVNKADKSKDETWMPYGGLGAYKDIGRGFFVKLESSLYFRQRPSQLSLNLVWKFMNMKLGAAKPR